MPTVVDRIVAYNQGRLAHLLKSKYRLMRESPFAFMRGTCHLFYEDWPQRSNLNNAPAVWVAGDLHRQNFAVYRGADHQIYFDINDFDESLLAPCVWDMTRLLTSLHIAYTKVPAATRKQIAQQCLDAYVATLGVGLTRNVQPDTAPSTIYFWMMARAGRNAGKLLNKYTTLNKKKRRLKTLSNETYALSDKEQRRVVNLFDHWRGAHSEAKRYRVIDVVGCIGGISSVGLERYLLLVEDDRSSESNLLLEIKERIDSALMPYVTLKQPDWPNAAARVVALQQRLQAIPPITPLEVVTNGETSYTLRELESVQEKVPYDRFKERLELQALVETLGRVTAWAHLRGSRRQGSVSADDLIAFAAQSAWQTDVMKYSADYAKQIVSDYKIFVQSKLGTEDGLVSNVAKVTPSVVSIDSDKMLPATKSSTKNYSLPYDPTPTAESTVSTLIFISYAKKNFDQLQNLVRVLENQGHKVWFDRELYLKGGQNWWGIILTEIINSELFIFALTQESLDSVSCRSEFKYASDLGKRILPVEITKLDYNHLPRELGKIQTVQFWHEEGQKRLEASFLNLPPSTPLPDNLPTPPEAPISRINEIYVQVKFDKTIPYEKQVQLVGEMEIMLNDNENIEDIMKMLKVLAKRDEFTAKLKDKVTDLIKQCERKLTDSITNR